MTESVVDLRLSEGTELAHAWVQSQCRSLGIRSLLIKGPGLAHHDLRDKRVSSDVDVLVHPADLEAAVSALEAAGWHRRPNTFAAERYTLHSVALMAPSWPCNIDVHGFYPGFLEDPATVFDVLWNRRVSLSLAHVDCDIPGRLSALLVLALHSLRSKSSDPRHASELRTPLERAEPDAEERVNLETLTVATGCDQTLSEIFPALGITPPPPQDSPALREWRLRVDSGATPTYMWFSLFRRAGHDRFAVLRHALWPSAADLRIMYPDLPATPAARVGARVRRWGRGLRAFPRVVLAARRTRNGRRDPSARSS